jgi:hypothetical protein
MKLQDLHKLADQFNKQVKIAQDTSEGAVDSVAFSKDGITRKGEFGEVLGTLKMNGHQLVGSTNFTNYLANFYNKTGQTFNVHLSVNVDSTNQKMPASWNLAVSPPALKQPLFDLLNKEYITFFGKTLQQNAVANSANKNIGPAKGISPVNTWDFS